VLWGRHRTKDGLDALHLKRVSEIAATFWSSTQGKKAAREFVESLVAEAKDEHEMVEAAEFIFGGPYLSAKNLRLKLAEEANVYAHTISQSLGYDSLAESLASESQGNPSTGMTISRALAICKDIHQYDILMLASKMDELEALMFWNCLLSTRPIPMHQKTFLHTICSNYHKRFQFSQGDIAGAYATTPFIELLIRVLRSPETIPSLKPRAGCAIRGALYKPWGKSILPEKGYLDIVRGKRHFLYIFSSKAVLRNREGTTVVGLKRKWDGRKPAGDWIVEVEILDDKLWCITDCLYYNESTIHLPYEERISLLQNWLSGGRPIKVIEPVRLTGEESATDIMSMMENGEIARIVDEGAYRPNEHSGWILVHHAFQFRLLITHIRRDKDGNIAVRLAALDGFDTYPIHTHTFDSEGSNNAFLHVNRRGFTPEEDWEDVEHLGIVVEGSCTDIDSQSLAFRNYESAGINGELGRGDVSQFTDIVEVGL